MKYHIIKQLRQYSTLASLITAGSLQSAAQVIYTDIPDTSGVESSNGNYVYHDYWLDLNNDGISDFHLSAESAPINSNGNFIYGVSIYALNTNAIFTSGTEVLDAARFDCNELIPGNVSNVRSVAGLVGFYQHCYNCFGYYHGNWLDTLPGLVGLQLMVNSETYFGWARISVSENGGAFVLYDYAYNASVNTPIIGCDSSSSVSVHELENEIPQWSASVQNGFLYLVLSEELVPSQVKIVDDVGRIYFSGELSDNNLRIPMYQFLRGIYIVELATPKGRTARKIFVE